MSTEKKYVINKKRPKKVYGINIDESLIHRLRFIRDLAKKKENIDVNKTLEGEIYKIVKSLEKKYNLNASSWKTANQCPRCKSLLIKREGSNGAFYGCSDYPNCTFTKKI